MGPSPKKILVVDNIDNMAPMDMTPGAPLIISKSRFAKMQARKAREDRTLVVVCRWCWHFETTKRFAGSGTLKKDKQTELFEHLDYCLGKKERDAQGGKP